MRLLVLNPNTSTAVSERLREVAAAGLRPADRLTVETARTGLPYIGDAAAMAIGARAARASLQGAMAAGDAFDAVVLGCFADLDTAGLQALARRPVVNLLGASVTLAARAGRRWAVVTAGGGWQRLLPDMFRAAIRTRPTQEDALRGDAAQGELVAVRTFETQDPAIAGDPNRMRGEVARLARLCADEDGADVVIVGGAGLGGLAPANVAGHRKVTVLDSVASALRVARELLERESPR
ncbi:aspartate/glutamate racemase family protein [Achromobacter aloeverae]|nr:aspartate/glutamate racemase family protein [Achromobacter aloeverae]